MTQFQYIVVLTSQPYGGFTVTVPSLPGCISEGETKKEALENIKDAIGGYLKASKERDLPLLSGTQLVEKVEVVSGVIGDAKTSDSKT